jgi:hypothetical protein
MAEFPREIIAMLGTILIAFLILALIGSAPRWSHSRDWGYFPTGGVCLRTRGCCDPRTSRPHLVFQTMPDLEVGDR